jgi:hypothetical protein
LAIVCGAIGLVFRKEEVKPRRLVVDPAALVLGTVGLYAEIAMMLKSARQDPPTSKMPTLKAELVLR